MSTVHLIGGGPDGRQATRLHLAEAVRALGKPAPLVAYVGAASNDHPGFFHLMTDALVSSGVRVEQARLARKNASTARARQLLDDADLIFLSGGDVEHGMRVLQTRGVDDHLRRLARAGKPFVGVSAGSIMAGLGWVRFPTEDEAHAEPFACLGIVPLHMDAHSEDDGWSELRVLMRLLPKAKTPGPAIGYGVPAQGCLRVEAGARPRLTALGAPVARLGVRRGKVVEHPALAPRRPPSRRSAQKSQRR